MTAFQLLAPMPYVTLDAGCTITLEAIDPATGATVSGVVVSGVAIYAVNATDELDPTLDYPLPVYVPVGDQGGP